ncbi:MAG: NUMOD4 domain-containing protein [Dysgonomonas sp.]
MEEWKEIADFEGLYLISSFGRVKSIINNKILTPCIVRTNGLVVGLMRNGKVEKRQVSRLVAAAFIPNPDNKPCVDHIDGVRFHNFVDNLRWCSINENNNFDIAIRNKTKYDFPIEGIDENGNVCIEFQNYKDAHKKGYYRHLIKQSVDTGKPYKGIIYRKK